MNKNRKKMLAVSTIMSMAAIAIVSAFFIERIVSPIVAAILFGLISIEMFVVFCIHKKNIER